MVVSSGSVPYIYHPSWDGVSYHFRIPSGQIVQPSAIHFEEQMFVHKAEYNRVLVYQSGFKAIANLSEFEKHNGRFVKVFSNDGISGTFDPDPSGRFLDGTFPLFMSSNLGGMSNDMRPGHVNSAIYIKEMRGVLERIFGALAVRGEGYANLGAANRVSGVKRDWLKKYKGYNDGWAESGKFYFETEISAGDPLPSGLLFDRYLDELRYQPIPMFGTEQAAAAALYPDWGSTTVSGKMETVSMSPLRPAWLKTDGSIGSSGWESGIQISRYISAGFDGSSGNGDVLVNGILIGLIGGANGTENEVHLISGVYGPGMTNELFPWCPRYASLTNTKPLFRNTIPSGAYIAFLAASGADISGLFPWGTGITSINDVYLDARWPTSGEFCGENQSTLHVPFTYSHDVSQARAFLVSDTMFATQASPNSTDSPVCSGLMWGYPVPGRDKAFRFFDSYAVSDTPYVTVLGSGHLWGDGNRNELFRTEDAVGAIDMWVKPNGFSYDRANNYFVRVGRSGTTGAFPSQISGYYARYDQAMQAVDAGHLGKLSTSTAVEWMVAHPESIAHDGTYWIISGWAQSGVGGGGDEGVRNGLFRFNSSFAMQDGIVFQTGTSLIGVGWVSANRRTGDILLTENTAATYSHGKASGVYYHVSSATWANLDVQAGGGGNSGSLTRTEYTPTWGDEAKKAVSQTANALSRTLMHKFFNREDDNKLFCTFIGYPSGESDGASDEIYLFLGEVDDSSHPYQIADAWIVCGLSASYTQYTTAGAAQVALHDPSNMECFMVDI